MNIFYLDEDPVQAAQYHCNSHVVKMIVETTQMLSYALHLQGISFMKHGLYRPNRAHLKHPCTLWVAESRVNFLWAVDLAHALLDEWCFRFSHRSPSEHRSFDPLSRAAKLAFIIPNRPETPPAQAFSDFKHLYNPLDPVSAYRAYYREAKSHLLRYKKRETPEWLMQNSPPHTGQRL